MFNKYNKWALKKARKYQKTRNFDATGHAGASAFVYSILIFCPLSIAALVLSLFIPLTSTQRYYVSLTLIMGPIIASLGFISKFTSSKSKKDKK